MTTAMPRDKREAAILALARGYLVGGKVGTPEEIRRAFMRAVGLLPGEFEFNACTCGRWDPALGTWGEHVRAAGGLEPAVGIVTRPLGGHVRYHTREETETGSAWDLTRISEGVIAVTLSIRDRATLNRLRGIAAPPPGEYTDNTGKPIDDPFDFLAALAFPDPGSAGSRAQRLDPDAVTTMLAVHYLSRKGAGARSLSAAAALFERSLGEKPQFYVGDEWPGTYRRLRRKFTQRFGPLGPRTRQVGPEAVPGHLTRP